MNSSYNRRYHTIRKPGGLEVEGPRPDRGASAAFAQTAPLLSAEAEHALAARIKAGDAAARQELTLANMRLVLAVAGQFKTRGMELDDLVQEGNLGLMRATETYDPDAHGTRFSTYAYEAIRNSLIRATSGDGSMIRFPYYMASLRKRFDRVKSEMVNRRRSSAGGPWGEPTFEEVVERMGIKPLRIRHLRQAQIDCTSYSTSTLDVEDAGASEDQISEHRPPETPVEIAEEMEGLHAALDRLPRFEAWLIKRRYRLDDQGDAPRTYRELERECGLGVFRLKQIEREAIDKLQRALSGSSDFDGRLPLTSDPAAKGSRRRATA